MYDFDTIARRYDCLNRLMTLGLDRCWRRKAVDVLVDPTCRQLFLDVATGTGDVARDIMRRAAPESLLTGIDISEEMLAIARRKVSVRATLMRADAEHMPFADNRFDGVSVAFGVRNFVHLEQGLAEMYRVLKPGGTLVVLELSTPDSPFLLALWKLYACRIIPLLGALVAGNRAAYSYLPQSILRFPAPEKFLGMLREAGFADPTCRGFTFGACRMFVARKTKV